VLIGVVLYLGITYFIVFQLNKNENINTITNLNIEVQTDVSDVSSSKETTNKGVQTGDLNDEDDEDDLDDLDDFSDTSSIETVTQSS
jgi:hypothetical protein